MILATQLARLLWALATPVGLFGDWRAREPVVVSPEARAALFSGFDPFFRAGGGDGAVQQVTSLPLQLFGIRLNEASGQGSAIIADDGGVQSSYAVGEEIAPGLTLKSVHFDHVIIQRGSAEETLYIDQSSSPAQSVAVGNEASPGAPPQGAPGTQGAPATPGNGPSPGAAPMPGGAIPAPANNSSSPEGVLGAVNMAPRTQNGSINGIVLSPRQGGEALGRAGFRPGDIIVQVNGRPVSSGNDITQLQDAIRPGARLSLMVERGGSTVPVSLILPENR